MSNLLELYEFAKESGEMTKFGNELILFVHYLDAGNFLKIINTKFSSAVDEGYEITMTYGGLAIELNNLIEFYADDCDTAFKLFESLIGIDKED